MTDGLVRWANRYTRGFDNVQPVSDLTDSWANGLAFCALIHTYFPDKFPSPNTLKTDTRADRLNNFKLAFNFAENELSVEPYLDPEDCVDFQEEKSIALYLSVLYDALKNNIPGFFPSVEWTKKHDEAEMQKKLDEYKARMSGEAGKLGGSVPTSKGEKIFLNRQKNLESTAAESTMSEAERKKRDDEMAALLAARKAKAEQEAKEREEKRKADAERLKKIMEEQAAQPPKPLVEIADESGYSVQLKGEGASKTKVSTLTMFTAVIREQGQPPKNCNTDSLKMLFHGPDKKITAKIIGGTLGSFTVGFTPKQAGEYLMEVQFNGKVVGGPLPLIVTNADGSVLGGAAPSSPAATSTPTPTTTASTPAPKPATPVQPKEEPKPKDEPKPAKPTPNASKTVVEGLVSEASDLRTYSFTIVANDANDQRIKTGGDKFDATIDGPSVATARVEDNNDGTYKVFYSLTQAGDYKISVRVGGNHISGSPFAVRCFEGKAVVDVGRVLTTFSDIKTVEVARCSMVVKVVTKSGKQKQEGGDGARLKAVCHNAKSGNLSTNITDNKNGTYTIEYAVASGKNTLDVQLDGKSLAGFPLSQVFNV